MHPFAQKKQGENQYTYYIENSNFACMTREDYLWQKENLGLDSHQLFNYKGTAKWQIQIYLGQQHTQIYHSFL